MAAEIYRKKIDLGGIYAFRVPGGEFNTERKVPGSYHCSGETEYRRVFRCSVPEGGRVFLTSEGINYEGEIYLGGVLLGETLPYCTYSFEATSLLREENELTIRVRDIGAPYGVTDGWCCYGGIIRPIYLEIRPRAFISDVWFRTELSGDFSSARATASVTVDDPDGGEFSLEGRLTLDGKTVGVAAGGSPLAFELDAVSLWSPGTPTLYDLTVTLYKNGEPADLYSAKVGFKKLEIDRGRFVLNGKPFFLVGVCRHDLGTDEMGQTFSDAEIERDMRLIKELGVNFVRLVHYPHDKRVIEAADRLGLMVSEEPGLWWSDISNRELTGRALEVLRRTILRDRGNVSVAFWMSFNECIFTQEFLDRSAAVCREYDPDRPVSGANCVSPEVAKPMFDAAGLDFYTFHPYGADISCVTSGAKSTKNRPSKMSDIFDAFAGKPLVFTEWGGWNVVDNPALFERFCAKMREGRDRERLAGMVYWAFADMYEYNRGPDACVDGLQTEGLVTIDRVPKINYFTYRKFIASIDSPLPAKSGMKECGFPAPDGILPLCINAQNQEEAWVAAKSEAAAARNGFAMRNRRTLIHGPVLPRSISPEYGAFSHASRKPAVLNRLCPRITAEGGAGDRLYILGNALFGEGWPLGGEYESVLAELKLEYADGAIERVPLRNGIELLTVMGTYGASAIEPLSPALRGAATFSYNRNFENYRIYLYERALRSGEVKISLELKDPGVSLLIYGVFLRAE